MYDQEGVVSGLLIELLGGIAKLRVAAAELRAFARWSDAFAQQRVASAGALRMKALQTITMSALPFIGTIGIFYIAGGGADPLDVASFAAFSSRLRPVHLGHPVHGEGAQHLDRHPAAVGPRPPGVRGAARGRA